MNGCFQANIRAALESNDDLQLMDQFTTDLKEDEVYVFTRSYYLESGQFIIKELSASVIDVALI